MEEIIGKVISFVVGFGSVSLVYMLWNLFINHRNKKRVLKAIKDLGIEEDLANCVVGCNLHCSLAIESYFAEHGWPMPYVGAWGNLELCRVINELRTKGKIKPLYDNLMAMKKKSDGHENAVMLRKAEMK